MKPKFAFNIYFLICLIYCDNSHGQINKISDSDSDSIELITINVPDSISNFQALLNSKHLYYLEHMDVDFDNFWEGFWVSVETKEYKNGTIVRNRSGGDCNKGTINGYTIKMCLEQQEHIIDKNINKVIKFSGSGSGYFATIEFKYDDFGNLIEYRHHNKFCYLSYDEKHNLVEVNITETWFGERKRTAVIKFI